MANPALRKLIQLFLKAETDIVNEIGRLRSQGLIDYHAAASLDRVQGILDGLVQDAREYVPQMVEHEFYVNSPEAARIAEPAVKHAAGYTNAAALSASQHAVVDRLVEQLMGEVLD